MDECSSRDLRVLLKHERPSRDLCAMDGRPSRDLRAMLRDECPSWGLCAMDECRSRDRRAMLKGECPSCDLLAVGFRGRDALGPCISWMPWFWGFVPLG